MSAKLQTKLADAIIQVVALLPEKERIVFSRGWLARGPRAVLTAVKQCR